MPRKSYPHVTTARRYARDVINGRKVAGLYERLACERFLRDLGRKDLEFRKERAERACKFIESFSHVKGKWAGKREKLVLSPWQVFATCAIFGFYWKKSGKRRFVEAYIRVARKNGKSTWLAAIALYMFVEDGEYGPEVYSGATTEKQAWEVYRPAKQMAERHPDFATEYEVEINAKNMNIPFDGARFEPMIGDPGDGASPHCAIIDEYHEHKSSSMYDTMTTGMGARDNPVTWIITTAGVDMGSPCFEKDDDCKRILEGTFVDDSIFALIYAADADDDWTSVTAMKKANPNLDISVSRDYLERRLLRAKRSPSDQAAYKTKHLNLWVGSGSSFLNPLEWEKCGDPSISIEQCIAEGWECIFGLDLASHIDFVALVRLFYKNDENGNLIYKCFPRFWLPENRLDDDATGQYRTWFERGYMELHDDDEIDFGQLRRAILDEVEVCSPNEIAFDPWRASGIEQELTAEGCIMVKIPQTAPNFATPMDELQAAHLSHRITHDGNAVMSWMAANLVAREDTNGNKKPRREIARNKIDGMVALLMAMNRALAAEEGYYTSGEVRIL